MGSSTSSECRKIPCLEPLHDHPTFQAIVEASDQLLEQRGPGVLAQWKDRYGETSYRYEQDSVHRLVYATALDDASHREMRQMLERQADHLIDAYFGAPPAYYVLIAVPTPEDAQALFDRKDQIGGVYEHSLRRLVARDIGSSLRHEFFHLMHFGHMVRLQQAHPVWIHEGLASLYEDYELSDTGDIRFIPNDRHNTAHALARQGKLTPWSELFASSQPQFMKQAAASYAQARSIFRYVAEQGLLEEWYRIYTTQEFKIDPTGASALEIVFQRQLNGIEKNWQAWLEKQDDVDVAVDFGDTGLGIQSEFRGSNDGVLVTGVVPKSSAHRAQLQPGDVVVAVNDEPTRSFLELRRLIGTLKVGYWVEIRLRRGETYLTVPLKIQPLPKK